MLAQALSPCESLLGNADFDLPRDGNPLTLGPYTLVEEIGRGGMGVIYRAVHRETREIVALKTVLPQHAASPEVLARFRREAQTAQSFDHPHTMPILAVGGVKDGTPFFTMPLALGGSLRHLNAKYHRRWRSMAELMGKVARAVHHAHRRGVLHRDIKPGNILFTEDHEPLVADFGLAKPLVDSDDLTRSYAMLGTPHYVAPEQAAGQTRDLTLAADIYSLGAVLYELLTGRTPFVGDTPLDVLRQVGTKSPVPPRRLLPAVPKELDQICMRCLERLPANRYASAQALADDLGRWLEGRALSRPPLHARWLDYLGRHQKVGWWCVAVMMAVFWFAWKRVANTVPTPPLTTVAMVVDELEPSSTARLIVSKLTDELRQNLATSRTFHLQEETGFHGPTKIASPNSLAYGRALTAQTALTCYVRVAGDQLHLIARLIRCDTGDVLWIGRTAIPADRAIADLPATARTIIETLTKQWNNRVQGRGVTGHQPSADAQTFYTRAMELAAQTNRRDLELAIELFERARKEDPYFVQPCAMLAFAQWTLGNAYEEDDQFTLAEATAKAALALDADCAQAHRVIASCYFQQVRLDEARREFETAVELDPESAGCCQSLGICLRQMGQPGRAIPWLQRAVRINPARGGYIASLGESLILCDLDGEAEMAFQRAADLVKGTPDTQFAMVALRVWQKQYGQARALCTVARARFPEYQFGLNFAAWVEFCDGQLPEARSLYEELLANGSYQKQWVFHGGINPASALAHIARRSGLAEQARSFADEAFRIDRELLAKYPGNSRVLHDMAATSAVTGDEQSALLYLEQALAAGWAEHRSTMIDPRFGTVAQLPTFKALMEGTRPRYVVDEAPDGGRF